jgi:signal peptidase I
LITQSDNLPNNHYRLPGSNAEEVAMSFRPTTSSGSLTPGDLSAVGTRNSGFTSVIAPRSSSGLTGSSTTKAPNRPAARPQPQSNGDLAVQDQRLTGDRTNHRANQPVKGRHAANPTKPTPTRSAIEWAIVLGGAIFVAFVVRSLLLQVFFIPSESMDPTLQIDDKVVVDKLSHRFSSVDRGEVVVFARPAGLTDGNIKDLVKRVIGVGGDTLEAVNGQVYVNGTAVTEPYLKNPLSTVNLPKTTVGAGQLFVMGDNRTNSTDSRIFGSIPESSVVGHARAIVWPLSHMTWFSAGER